MSEKKLLSESAVRRLMKYANLDQATAEEFVARNAIQEEDSSQELELDAAADLDDANADLEDAADDLADATADIESAEDDLVAAAEAPMDEDQVEALVDAVLSAISDVTGVEAEVVSDVAAAELDDDAAEADFAAGAEMDAADDELELADTEDIVAMAEKQGEKDRDDESEGERLGAVDKHEDETEEDRRDDSLGDWGSRTKNEAALIARVTRRVAERLLKSADAAVVTDATPTTTPAK